jgi:23S rRNA (uridine2552-2'-O)-methyltransferase
MMSTSKNSRPKPAFVQNSAMKDITDDLLLLIGNRPVDLVISDMAPNLTGAKAVDQPAMMYLAELAIDLTTQVLKPDGVFISKVFQGEGFDQFVRHVRTLFNSVSMKKPEASRAKSREVYLVAKGLKSN